MLATADDEKTAREDALLDAIALETGLPLRGPEAGRSIDDLAADIQQDFDDDRARRILLLELAGVAVIDGVRESETGLLEDLADRLDLRKELPTFIEFAERARELAADGARLTRLEA